MFNHAYDFAFEVISKKEDGEDVTPVMLRQACLERITKISDQEIMEACGLFDTFEVEAT
tara:strand:+ start:94 stop:270 length:177 start_codon:yes stop_codon:yes gene_type:complete